MQPQGALPTFFFYELSCEPTLGDLDTPSSVTTAPGTSTADVTNMEDGASYLCSVFARVGGYVSQPATSVVTTAETGMIHKQVAMDTMGPSP